MLIPHQAHHSQSRGDRTIQGQPGGSMMNADSLWEKEAQYEVPRYIE